MMDFTAPGASFDQYRRFITLHAKATGLEWSSDGTRIQQLSREADAIARTLDLRAMTNTAPASGLYFGQEDLCATWMAGHVEPWQFAYRALDFLANELSQSTSFASISTMQGLACAFGPAIVDPMFDLVTDMLGGLRQETRRFETTVVDDDTDEEQEIYAPAGDYTDDRFCEAPLARCDPGARCATPITIANLDEAAFESLTEFVEQRDRLARKALRGELG